MNSKKLTKKIYGHGHILLQKKGYISPINLYMSLGWLTEKDVKLWRDRKIPYLERVTSANLSKLNFALKTLREFAKEYQLKPSTTAYKSWGKGPKVDLKFSKSGQPHMEKLYHTHYVQR